MTDIPKIIEEINLPKQILEKGEQLLKTLFGPSLEELGGLFGDQIRLRRFNNQAKIMAKALETLRKNHIDPKKVSLKILAPLIEYSSLEEDESLQARWSNLICHIVGGDKEVVFHQNCITILNKLSADEAKLLDVLHEKFNERRQEKYIHAVESYNLRLLKYPDFKGNKLKSVEDYALDSIVFNVSRLAKELGVEQSELEFSISNLISLGLLKWETDVEVDASKSSDDPDDTDIDVDVSVYNNDNFIFTSIGDKFVKVCK
jgi:hypothetical protein